MQTLRPAKKEWIRIALWTTAAGYTVALPHSIILFNFFNRTFSLDLVRGIPRVTIFFLAILYLAYGLYIRRGVRPFLSLGISAFLAWCIIHFEPIQVTHFHIPEYVLLSWIVYHALTIDYYGKGIFSLTFVCTALLGVIEELLQGVHPERYFLASDMAVNAVSAIIGAVSIAGLKTEKGNRQADGWYWTGHLISKKYALMLLFTGFIGAGIMVFYLLNLRAAQAVWRIYPRWLLTYSAGFIFLSVLYFLNQRHRTHPDFTNYEQFRSLVTAQLWIICPLALLVWMHSLIFIIIPTGWQFE